MKKTLLLCMALFGALALNAQEKLSHLAKDFIKGDQTTLKIQKMDQNINPLLKKSNILTSDATTLEGTADEYTMNPKELTLYPPTIESLVYTSLPVPARSDASFACYFGGALVERFVGNKITEIYLFPSGGTATLEVWIRKDITGENLWSTTLSAGEYEGDKINAIPCDYEIDGDFFLGYTHTMSSMLGGNANLYFSQELYNDYGLIVGQDGQWYDYSNVGTIFFACLTTGDAGLRTDDVELSAINLVERVQTDKGFLFPGVFTNYGTSPVYSFKTAAEINGVVKEVEFETEEPVGYLETYNFSVPVTTPSKSGRYAGSMEITDVNGYEDEYLNDNRQKNEWVIMDHAYQRKVVLEELTGTWCGYCPRGSVALEKLTEKYPDDCINIAVHGMSGTKDPFMADSYKGLYDAGFGYPTALLNRLYSADPYLGVSGQNFGITQVVDWVLEIPSEAAMALESKLSDDKKTVDIKTSVLFGLNNPGCPYAVAYVLTEDGLTGTQTNYYSSEAGMFNAASQLPADLQFLWDEPYNYNTTFNHVARQINDLNGIENSLSGAVETGKMKTHSYTLTLPNTIEDLNKTTLIAMLVDTNSGEIVTAIKSKIGETVSSVGSINATPAATIDVNAGNVVVTADNATVYVYTTAGQLAYSAAVNGATTLPAFGMKGVHIVKVVTENDVVVKRVMF